jgi:hypothetical protein
LFGWDRVEYNIPNKKEEAAMDIVIGKGCGLDVHKGTVVACIMGCNEIRVREIT